MGSNYTVLSDNVVTFGSPVGEYEAEILNPDLVDPCEYVQDSEDRMEDYSEKVVLDSDDEAADEREAINLVNRKCLPGTGSSCRRDTVGFLKRQRVSQGYFHQLGNEFTDHEIALLHSTNIGKCYEERNAGRNCLYTGVRFQDDPVVIDGGASRLPYQKPIRSCSREFKMDPLFLDQVGESMSNDSFSLRKLHSDESITAGRDRNYEFEAADHNYFEYLESAESQGKALEFVDYYLSDSVLGSYKDVESRDTNRLKSPPSLRSKGSLCLARRINLRSSPSKSITFEWDEKQIELDDHVSLGILSDSILGLEGGKSGELSVKLEANNVNLQKEMPDTKPKENLSGSMLCTNNLEISSSKSSDIDKAGSGRETFAAYDSMDLDEISRASLSQGIMEKGENIILELEPDAFDIGIDTQMAAEAMEALTHSIPSTSASRGSDGINLEPSCTETGGEAFVGWRCKKKRSKCVNIFAVQDNAVPYLGSKRFKNQKGIISHMEARKSAMNEILMNKRALKSSFLRNIRNCDVKGLPGLILNEEEYEYTQRQSWRVSLNADLRVYKRRLKNPKDGRQSGNPPGQRNMINFHCQSFQVGPCLEFNFDPSLELKPETEKCIHNPIQNETDRNPSKLNIWIFPKRKRSGQSASSLSIRSSNLRSPCAGKENNKGQCTLTNKGACERVAGRLVYARRSKISLKREQMIGSSSSLAGDSSSSSILHIATSAQQDSSKQEYWGNNSSKLPCNHSSRSPLMKELVRLGYSESLPDFLPKVSRRRRSKEKVCILFSQHMETSILKRQKKIVARLQFSIASCCSDATHFVANEFMRTRNMLEAIALGKPVVTHLWLEGCEQAGYPIDEKSYILRDEIKEKKIGFSLPVSLSRATQHPLLKGKRVLITASVKPSIDVIRVLVLATAGQEVHSLVNSEAENKVSPEDLLILSSDEDYGICLQFLDIGASTYSSELLLNGIITQKLEYERYQLFKEFTKRALVENR